MCRRPSQSRCSAATVSGAVAEQAVEGDQAAADNDAELRDQMVEAEDLAVAIVYAAGRDHVGGEEPGRGLQHDPVEPVHPAAGEGDRLVRAELQQRVLAHVEVHDLARDGAARALVELARRGGGEEGAGARLQHAVEVRDVALDEAAAAVHQQHERLVVVVLVVVALPLEGNAPAERVDFRAPEPARRADVHQRVLTDDPFGIRLYRRAARLRHAHPSGERRARSRRSPRQGHRRRAGW